jgi:hypothetical protein
MFTVLSGKHSEGYLAVDDFVFFDNEPDCYIQPAWADPDQERAYRNYVWAKLI